MPSEWPEAVMSEQELDAGAFDALPDGEMREVAAGGETVLLLRDGAAVRAIGGTCPHAGGKLAEGVRRGDRVVCPWHKATFCLRTGALLEPPAVDAVAAYDVRVDAGRVKLSRRAAAKAAGPGGDARCFVVVGAGAAGALAAQSLRAAGFGGRVVMVDRENRVPHDRTVLSKYRLSGEKGGEKSPLQSQAFYRAHGIERVTGEVVRLDAASRRIECADGSVLRYDAALVATGGVPNRPDLPGVGLANVFVLRSREDADAVLKQAERSLRAVVLGAGFIGMEVAASLRERGLEVAVVGQERVPFERQLGAAVGAALVRLHEDKGVRLLLGREVAGLEGEGAVHAVRLTDGERLAADLVVIGFGVRPATAFVEGVRRGRDDGIAVDGYLRAADGLYAAGDVARFPLYGAGEPVRVEHWRVAEQHGRVAAWNMAGGDVRYDMPPVFWTIQYRKRLDYVGHAEDWDDIVLHGDVAGLDFLAYYVKDGRVAAAAGMGRDRETAALVELFTVRQDWRPSELEARPSAMLASLGG